MSKVVKEMQMDVLDKTFGNVRDMIFMTVAGLTSVADNQLRRTLLGKKIRLQMVKNSLLRKVIGKHGITLPDEVWAGPTVVAWGADSIKELSIEIDTRIAEIVKKNVKLKDLFKVKTAVADGQAVPLALAKTMPTRLEAIGEIVNMILAPASAIAGCLSAPAGQIASQIEQIEKKAGEAVPEGEVVAAGEAPPAETVAAPA